MVDRIDSRFDAVDSRFDAVDRRFEAVDRRFDAVDRRFDAVDRRFDRLEERMESGFVEIRDELRAMNARMFNAAVALIASLLTVFVTLLIHTA